MDRVWTLDWELESTELVIARDLLDDKLKPTDSTAKDLVEKLRCRFIIHDDPNATSLDFVCPIAKRMFVKMVFKNRPQENLFNTIEELVVNAVGHMSHRSFVQQAMGSTEGLGNEAAIQHLFFGALHEVVSSNHEIVAELSAVLDPNKSQGIEGLLDFFINGSLKWGLELLRRGDRLGEHFGRFDSGNAYCILDLADYRVVDFGWDDWNPTLRTRHRVIVRVLRDEAAALISVGNEQAIKVSMC
jgi:hypothetical protein